MANLVLEFLIKKLLTKKEKTLTPEEAERSDEGFIPYVCHYDETTILTKNGELLKTIKISGFNQESEGGEFQSVRDAIRNSIVENSSNTHFAFWFHTIRRKEGLSLTEDFKEFLPKKVNEIWSRENEVKTQFINDLYITIIVEGADTKISNLGSFLHSISYSAIKSSHKLKLYKAHEELTDATNRIFESLKGYNSEIIGIREKNGVLYSDPTKFFAKIVNLEERDEPLVANEIAEELLNHKFLFGNRELEVIGDQKSFAAIFSIKEYHNMDERFLSKLMNLPSEFIITQSFDFSKNKKDLDFFQSTNDILLLSGDEEFRYLSGLDELVEEKNNATATSFGKLQTTLMVISDSKIGLQNETTKVLEELQNLGIVAIREDIFTEHCFWAQLPANFKFLRRQKTALFKHISGFSSLSNVPLGNVYNGHWGEAVVILKTILNTPYFFNFHDQEYGHTLIIGSRFSGRTVLTNFLLANARKVNYKLFYFDRNKASECFIKGLGGSYFRIYDKVNGEKRLPDLLQINPFLQQDSPSNRLFLVKWLRYLLAFSSEPTERSELDLIPSVVEKIFEQKIKNLADCHELFHQRETKNIYKKLERWCKLDKFSYAFDCKKETEFPHITGFDFDALEDSKIMVIPAFSYLLHKISASLDGSPTIVVLDEAWSLIDNKIIAPIMANFLEKASKKNCMVIFIASSISDPQKTQIGADILKYIATEIYMPNSTPDDSYEEIFQLNKDEIGALKMMDAEQNHFYIRHGKDAIVASLNLKSYPELHKILSANDFILESMQKVTMKS